MKGIDAMEAGITASGGAGGSHSAMYAITPEGKRINPDADGVLRVHPEDTIYHLSGGGGGRGDVTQTTTFVGPGIGRSHPARSSGTRFTITFEQPMDATTAGAFGLWLDATIRASAEDDPESDHGPFRVSIGYQ